MNTTVRYSGMARVLKGSHSFTCTTRMHPLEGNKPYLLWLACCSWYSFTDSGVMGSWAGLEWLVGYIPK